ncbi:SAGA complex subunit Sgf73 [Dispira parvispora]|uniref:SAGA complex subunit Sgf73 n=1 Tax=Dispira parvispora TaxID=1520584 RepID=A0A9W8AQB4_9FUNG|nr:SAGA complex subunit Sgf73 [Dispira parvispora]
MGTKTKVPTSVNGTLPHHRKTDLGKATTSELSSVAQSVFHDSADWNPLPTNGALNISNPSNLESAQGGSPPSPVYKDLERLFREVDSIDQWAPVRADPQAPPSVTRTLNPDLALQLGIQPLDQEVVVVPCEQCQKPVAKRFLADHQARTCPKRSLTAEPNGSQATENVKTEVEELLHSGNVTTLPPSKPASRGRPSTAKPGETRGRPRLKKGPKAQTKKADSPALTPATGTTSGSPSKVKDLSAKRSFQDLNEGPSSSQVDVGARGEASPGPPEKKVRVKKEKKTTPKANPRTRGPVDLDKQCGVLGPNNTPCARSLTCKTHSMGAKRAVLGRSQLYDILLKSHLAKSRSAAALKNAELANASNNKTAAQTLTKQEEEEEMAMTSDEEVDLVMKALQFNRPQPLAIRITPFVRRRHHYLRVRDTLLEALQSSRGSQVFNE